MNIVKKLQQELETAVQEEATVNASYRKHLIRCARADCLQLTKMMHERLPRELRDLVYQYLLVDERPILAGPYYHFRKYDPHTRQNSLHVGLPRSFDAHDIPRNAIDGFDTDEEEVGLDSDAVILPDGRVKHDHSHKPPSDMVLPNSHVLNPSYVGESFAAEAHEVYYTNNTFSICNVERAIFEFIFTEPLRKFFNRKDDERFTPRAALVRNLQIRIKMENFESTMPFSVQQDYATEEEKYAYERNFLRYHTIYLKYLGNLTGWSRRRELNIEFILMTDLPPNPLPKERIFVNMLQAIRDTVYTNMYIRKGMTIRVTHYDEAIGPFPRDLTGLFSLTKEQWEREQAVHHGKSRWVADFYLAPEPIDVATLGGGFSEREMLPLLRERWGIDSAFDTKCKYPITEGRYWPKGNSRPGWV
ncbi:hypothetical protein N0V83_009118 [Neocucurbitaria cava]|uniref:Uncharacterized protein n=1 Tax=Neocucurbitaria cava TaxID=798079 RepID=A0A9W8Y2S7_9PLEO|nr:hypothetical protein N0V83_009118 [Neocucurbitaria cava]